MGVGVLNPICKVCFPDEERETDSAHLLGSGKVYLILKHGLMVI